MTNPSLVILAAGMGSRYGGLKQLDQLGPSGETIIDYSLHDALEPPCQILQFQYQTPGKHEKLLLYRLFYC